MSSHHIVREKQEPALLVLGLNNFPDEQLGQLLEWSPTVITTQQTAEKLNSYGIKVDWIITNDENEVLQSDVKLIPAGENTLLDAALKYLIQLNYPTVNIISDQLNLKDYEVFVDKINLVIFNNNKKIYPVTSGFNKWKPFGEIIEVLSSSRKINFTGLEKTKDHQYKTTNDGFFSLHFSEPFLFIAEEI
ncbi:MAG TPA: hypothetical protein VKC90_06745 [Chitinophagaceae bacterium]|nr:hypothetical protein [Chitinophagaceae bacterium]